MYIQTPPIANWSILHLKCEAASYSNFIQLFPHKFSSAFVSNTMQKMILLHCEVSIPVQTPQRIMFFVFLIIDSKKYFVKYSVYNSKTPLSFLMLLAQWNSCFINEMLDLISLLTGKSQVKSQKNTYSTSSLTWGNWLFH